MVRDMSAEWDTFSEDLEHRLQSIADEVDRIFNCAIEASVPAGMFY